jgi:hypothetical protein
MNQRLALPSRQNHTTRMIRIAGQRTLCISVQHDEHPTEILLRVKGANYSSELIGLYDLIARLISFALQRDLPH